MEVPGGRAPIKYQAAEQPETVVHGDPVSLLRNAAITEDTNWIVGGDFNSSVKSDDLRDRGNWEIVDRMNALGLTDCLSHSANPDYA